MGLISSREAQPKPAPITDSGICRERLMRVSGMWCGACAWLIEHSLSKMRGIVSAEVFFASDLLKVQYDPRLVPPGFIEAKVKSLGYRLSDRDDAKTASEAERKDLLIRLGVAIFFWLNVMALNFAVYAGHFGGLPDSARPYLPFAVMALASPVIFYSAQPVFRLAWGGLRNGVVRMEALLSLGIVSAFGFSTLQSILGSHRIYFDVGCAITALTLLGKWVERSAKERTASAIGGLYETMPRKARRIDAQGHERFVKIDALHTGDEFLVKAGERIAADGVVIEGESHADESLLTGESSPVAKRAGDRVTGGSVNGGGVLRVRALAVGANSVLSQILRSVEHALSRRAAIERNADKAARIAVPLVLLFAALVGVVTGDVMRAVSILVIACPCALGLATPLALTSAVAWASRRGVLIGDARVLETIRKLDVAVLDKTGTLTYGKFRLLEAPEADLAAIAAVERYSEHPLGKAVLEDCRAKAIAPLEATAIEVHAGQGISGVLGGRRLYIGSGRLFDGAALKDGGSGRTTVFYGWDRSIAGRLIFGDELRFDAKDLVRRLKAAGIRTMIVSGDSQAATAWVAHETGADEFRAETMPEGKSALLRHMQSQGLRVAMIGDGINDAPALASADLGIAMGGGADLAAKASAIVLMRNDLGRVAEVLDMARRTLRVVKQNLCWSFTYNVIGLAIAAAGLLNPIVASGAMVVSSLCVTANALRLGRSKLRS